MPEPWVIEFIQDILTDMAKRGVTEVMTEGDRLGQVFIKVQGSGYGAAYLGDFQRVSQSGHIMVTQRRDEHLGLMFEPAESLAVDNAVTVTLESGPYRAGLFVS